MKLPFTNRDAASKICSQNVGVSTYQKPMGLHGLLQGKIYSLLYRKVYLFNQMG
jgi:hypothetical protein